MEAEALEYNNLNQILNEFVNDLMNTYKSLLIRDNKKSSGNLIDSIRNYGIRIEGDEIVGEISLASYWKYVENGRKPGRMPPVNNIFQWIDKKPIMPRPMNGLKAPSRKTLAFLIARKIGKEGIKSGNQFQEALDITWNKWEGQISEAVYQDIQQAFDRL